MMMEKVKKLAKSVKNKKKSRSSSSVTQCEYYLVGRDDDEPNSSCSPSRSTRPKKGCFVVYVGDEMERFVVPICYLSHPLFKMMLEKAENEFGLEHFRDHGLAIPCDVSTFQKMVGVMGSSRTTGQFHLDRLVDEFIIC